MLTKLKEYIKRKIIYKSTYNNDTFIEYLRQQGVTVGEYTHFFSPQSVVIDVTRPYLLKIGSRVKITAGVTILTHDYSYSVLRPVFNSIQNECSGYTIIEDNVFIGMNASIMPGVKIGENSIIAVGAVVTKDVPSNSVVAGCPAKVISSLEDFYKKRKERQIEDAFRLANIIRTELNREPTIQEMGSFYPLFLERKPGILAANSIRTRISGDVEKDVISSFYSTSPIFDGFDDFLEKSKNVLK